MVTLLNAPRQIFGIEWDVYLILLVLGIPVFDLVNWFVKKYIKPDKRRKTIVWILTIIITPITYIVLAVLFFLLLHFRSLSSVFKSKPVIDAIIAKSNSCRDPNHPCTFLLSDLTDFEWDKLYLFEEYTQPERISSVLKAPYKGSDVHEDKTRMIFTLKNEVVHEEDFDWGSSREKVINNIALPIDTNSSLTEKGCYTKLLPFVTNGDATYELRIIGPETNPLFTKLEKKNQRHINLVFIKDLGKCYDEQITVEEIP